MRLCENSYGQIPNLGVTGSNPVGDANEIKDLGAAFSPQQILWVPYGFPRMCARKIASRLKTLRWSVALSVFAFRDMD